MRGLVITILLVLLLLVGADRVAAYAANRGVAQAVQQSAGLAEEPEVSIKGFPLLTQALRGEYQRVEGSATGLTAEDGLTIQRLDLALTGVQVPLGDLVGGQVTELPVRTASATGLVTYDAINEVARQNNNLPGLTFTFGPGTEGRIAVTGKYEGIITASISGEAAVAVDDGQLVVRPERSTLRGVPAFVSGPIVELLSGRYQLPPFPFGFQATDVRVGETGVTVSANARNAVLQAQ